jgi:flagellar motor switch protein FliN/FliY
MSAASSAPPVPDAEVNEYLQMWTEHMGQVLTQIAGAPFTLESALAAPPETPAPEEQDLQASVAAAGSLRGEMRLRVPRAVVLAVGQLFLQESQDATAELKPDHRDALQELLRQTAGQLATALSARWGETQLRVEEGAAPSWAAGARGWLVSAPGAPSRMLMEWQLSSALVAALRPPLEKPPESEPAKPDVPTSDKLDLLMDVELDVTLRFGSRSMLLRGILELDAGSVVELDRQVREPADLLLDGRLIARGEVVVVDGNYGLRVQEIVSPPRIVGGL